MVGLRGIAPLGGYPYYINEILSPYVFYFVKRLRTPLTPAVNPVQTHKINFFIVANPPFIKLKTSNFIVIAIFTLISHLNLLKKFSKSRFITPVKSNHTANNFSIKGAFTLQFQKTYRDCWGRIARSPTSPLPSFPLRKD